MTGPPAEMDKNPSRGSSARPDGPVNDSPKINPDSEPHPVHPTGEKQAAENREVDPPA